MGKQPKDAVCGARVFRECFNKPKVKRDGVWYCGVHDPGAPTGEKVYRVFAPWYGDAVLIESDVLKRTDKTVTPANTRRFPRRMSVSGAHFTKEAALRAYVKRRAHIRDIAERDLITTRREYEKAVEMLRGYGFSEDAKGGE